MAEVPDNVVEGVLRTEFTNNEPYPPHKTLWGKKEDGEYNFNVYNDGEWHEIARGGGGAVESVNGQTGVVVLDAADVGAYELPSTGIPSTDLSSSVQTSLGKADTAYQKPSGGIPSTDLASAVQTSLGKADTAIQDISGKQDTLVSGTNIKTINNTSVLGSGNIDTKEVFVAEYGVTTVSDITTALSQNKSIICFYNGYLYVYSSLSGIFHYFYSIQGSSNFALTLRNDNGTWGQATYQYERTNNKKTTITGNESSTDYYPSTKAVADYVDGIVGDINTILDNINGEVI